MAGIFASLCVQRPCHLYSAILVAGLLVSVMCLTLVIFASLTHLHLLISFSLVAYAADILFCGRVTWRWFLSCVDFRAYDFHPMELSVGYQVF